MGRVSSSSAPHERLPKTPPSDRRPGTPRRPHAEVPGLLSPKGDAEPLPHPAVHPRLPETLPGPQRGAPPRGWQVSRVGLCGQTGSPQGHACLAIGSLVGLASALLGGDSVLWVQHLPTHAPLLQAGRSCCNPAGGSSVSFALCPLKVVP